MLNYLAQIVTFPHRHITTTENLNSSDLQMIFDQARAYRAFFSRESHSTDLPSTDLPSTNLHSADLHGIVIVNAFFENSTRTRTSFEMAAKRLGADVINFSASASSVAKGESLFDTLQTLDAMAPECMVIRHNASGAADFATRHVRAQVLNAGDGAHQHPTQGLLDALTLLDELETLSGKTIGICGDLLHSRVFRSNYYVLRTLGARVVVAAPSTLLPRDCSAFELTVVPDAQTLVDECDAVMTLRLQKERMQSGLIPSIAEYANRYAIRSALFKNRSHVPVLHPGPVNYGVEIEYEIANSSQSLIRQQVANGVFVRMACLSLMLREAQSKEKSLEMSE